jgi:hypothetical protein
MLRLLIGTGVLLMAVGFGAAGWQYWQSMPKAAEAVVEDPAPTPGQGAGPVAPSRQSWLISPTGGLVPQEDVRAYLAQDRFAPRRTVRVTRQARLDDLLAEGERLPEVEYLEVLADIRAPRVAEGLCAVMLQYGAADCAVNSARVVEGSVDPAAGTALFRLELVYRLPDVAEDVPDLAAHVLRTEVIRLAPEAGDASASSAETALGDALAATAGACAAETGRTLCRPMRLSVDWLPGQPVSAQAVIGWLDPLPKGMFVAPPLDPAKGG